MLFKNLRCYTIGDNSDNQPKVLTFTGTPTNGDDIYVVHRGIGTFQRTPPAGSVDTAQLATGLRSMTTDAFSGTGSATHLYYHKHHLLQVQSWFS